MAANCEVIHIRDILKAAFKTGSGSALAMGLGVIAQKIMAVIIGPAGIGIWSMLSQVNQSASMLGAVGGSNAIVQGTASRQGKSRDTYLVSVFWILIAGGAATSLAIIVLAPWIASFALGERSSSMVWLIRWLALPVFLVVILTYMGGVINGFRAIGRLAVVQTAAAAAYALLAFPVSHLVHSGYTIAFIGLMSASSAAAIVASLVFARREGWLLPLRKAGFRPSVDRDSARHFFIIAATTLATTVFGSVMLLLVRSSIVSSSGLASAGVFNVSWTIGFSYALLILSSFGTYYFPTLSLTKDRDARIVLMQKILRVSTLVIAPTLVLVILLKPFVVQLFYSNEFIDSLRTLRWMLVGDYLKTAGWVFAMPMIAYMDMRTFLWTEVSWWVGFIAISEISVQWYGDMQGIGFAFFVLYAVYLAYVFYYARSRHGFALTKRLIASWSAGLLLVVVSSWWTWDAKTVDWLMIVPWLAALGIFGWFSLVPSERGFVRGLLHLKGKVDRV